MVLEEHGIMWNFIFCGFMSCRFLFPNFYLVFHVKLMHATWNTMYQGKFLRGFPWKSLEFVLVVSKVSLLISFHVHENSTEMEVPMTPC